MPWVPKTMRTDILPQAPPHNRRHAGCRPPMRRRLWQCSPSLIDYAFNLGHALFDCLYSVRLLRSQECWTLDALINTRFIT